MNEQKKIDEESGLNHMDYVNNHDFFTENPVFCPINLGLYPINDESE